MQHDLIAQARTWLAEDPDPETRDELAALIDAGDTDELAARVAGPRPPGPPRRGGAGGAGPPPMKPGGG
ncbi:phospho-sugar mutase, partial [Streptomyces sp. 7G]|nr:phospho-sugar mutase [Streptomyces sp. 7G]